MVKLIIQGLTIIAAVALVVDATLMLSASVTIPLGKRKRSVEIQGLPSDCQAEVDVDKRDNSGVDFIICLKKGKVCTTRDVSACSQLANECESFKPPYDKQFKAMFPDAYGQVCVEPISGEQCMYTDIVYETCNEAKIMNDRVLCLPLSNGETQCAEIPDEVLLQQMVQNENDDQLPQYHPHEKQNGAKVDEQQMQQWP